MDLSFQGVPDKTTVTIYPTKNCLIALDDAPTPFVLALTDIQLCHFERVSVTQMHIHTKEKKSGIVETNKNQIFKKIVF